MNLFDVQLLAYILHELSEVEAVLIVLKITGNGAIKLDEKSHGVVVPRANKALDMAETFFKRYHRIGSCLQSTRKAKEQWGRSPLDISSAGEIIHRLQIDIVSDLEHKKLIEVFDDRASFVDEEYLFGGGVATAFPSATQDITEAGNCLAVECNTAAIFHLMRASEVALRALAVDRNV